MPKPIGRGEYYRSSTLIIITWIYSPYAYSTYSPIQMDSTARDGSSSTELNGPNSGVVGNGLSMIVPILTSVKTTFSRFSQTQECNFFQSSSKEEAVDGNKRSWDEQNSSSFSWEDEQYHNKRHQTRSDKSPHNSEDDDGEYKDSSPPYRGRYKGYNSHESDQDH